jgi:xylulokinase
VTDVLGVPMSLAGTSEGAAAGAAILASVGAGWHPTVEAACETLVAVSDVTEPGPDRTAYESAYAVYRDLYPALRESFTRLAG